jgi:hypothetical protein
MRLTIALLGTVIALLVFGFVWFLNEMTPGTLPGPGEAAYRLFPSQKDETVWINVPARADEPDEKRAAAYETCSTHSVKSLALVLDTKATPVAVARDYARSLGSYPWWTEDAETRFIYEGCLRGFSRR